MPKKSKTGQQSKSDRYVKYVRKLCEYFRRAVWAGEYRMEVEIDCEPEKTSDGTIVARIKVDATYLTLSVHISKTIRQMFNDRKFYDIANVFCHEFCHVLTQPLYELAIADAAPSQISMIEDVRERQTERTAASILALVPEGVWKPRQRKVKVEA